PFEPRRRRKPDLVVYLPALEIAVGPRLQSGDLRRAHAQRLDEPGLQTHELAVLEIDPGRALELLDDFASLGHGLVARPGRKRHDHGVAAIDHLAAGDLDVIHAEDLVDDGSLPLRARLVLRVAACARFGIRFLFGAKALALLGLGFLLAVLIRELL